MRFIGCGGRWTTVDSLSCSRNQFQMISPLSHVALLLPCWKQPSEDGYTTIIKGWAGLNRLWHTSVAQLVQRGPKCAEKITPTALHHYRHQPEAMIQGRTEPCFHIVYAKFWPYHRNRDSSNQATFFPFSRCPILVTLCESEPPFYRLDMLWYTSWSSASWL